jgi:peroxiredoxin
LEFKRRMQFRVMGSLAATVLMLGLTMGLAGCSPRGSRAEGASSARPAEKRKPAPDFQLKDANGQLFHLADYKGKVVLLNFWATWCGPCKIEIPWFAEFEREYKDRGFAVIGIAMDDEGWPVVKPYVDRRQMNYRVAVGSPEIEQLYGGGEGIESLPTTFVIDRQGKVADVHIGLIGKSDYKDEIEELLR